MGWEQIKIEPRQTRVSFEEAKTVFYDDCALVIADPDSSETEDRFVILGFSANTGILVVCHCYRDNEDVIRIISARRATRNESSHYKRWGKETWGKNTISAKRRGTPTQSSSKSKWRSSCRRTQSLISSRRRRRRVSRIKRSSIFIWPIALEAASVSRFPGTSNAYGLVPTLLICLSLRRPVRRFLTLRWELKRDWQTSFQIVCRAQ